MKVEIAEKTLRTTDGFDLFYRRYRPKGVVKCVVVGLHGISLHSGHYIQWSKELAAEGIYVLSPDLRGRGRSVSSAWPKGHVHSIRRMSEDITELRKAYANEIAGLPVYIMGASMGGVIGLYHAKYTDHIDGVAAGGPPFGAYTHISLLMTSLLARISPDFLMKGKHNDIRNLAVSKSRVAELQRDPLVVTEGMTAASTAEVLRTILQMQKVVPYIKVPILIVYGDRDGLITGRQIEIMKDKLASKYCEIKVIEGMGHDMLGDEQHDAVLKAMWEWLGRLQPSLFK